MTRISIVALTLLVSSVLSGQPRQPLGGQAPAIGTISGKVVDAASQKPVEYANISVYRVRDSSLVTGTISSADGSYAIREVPPGRFYIEIGFIGFDKITVPNVEITPQKTVFQVPVTTLKPAVAEIDGVEVVGKRNYIEYKIDKKVINVSQDIASSGGNAVDVLQNAPSVNVDIEGNLTLRGSSSFRVLVNGKPQVLDGNDLLKQLPATGIENIEIITNPSAKYDPDGNSGIINIITKKSFGEGLSGLFNASAGLKDKYSSDVTLNYKTEKFKLSAGGNWADQNYEGSMRSDKTFFTDTVFRRVLSQGNRDMFRKSIAGKAGAEWYVSPSTTITISGNFGEQEHGRKGYMTIDKYGLDSRDDSSGINTSVSKRGGYYYSGNLGYEQVFQGDRHKLSADFSYNYENTSDTETTDEFRIDTLTASNYPIRSRLTGEQEEETEIRFKVDYERPLSFGAHLETGYQFRLEQETDVNSVLDNETPAYNSEFGSYHNIQAGYFNVSHKLFGLDYQVGLRVENTDRRLDDSYAGKEYKLNRFDYFPSVFVSKTFKNNYETRASYSRRIERPGGWALEPLPQYMNATNIRIGDPNLKPEYVDSYELALQKSFGQSFISLEGYFRKTNNLFQRIQEKYDTAKHDSYGLIIGDTALTTIHKTVNLSHDYSTGLELMTNMEAAKWLRINASGNVFYYTISDELTVSDSKTETWSWNARLSSTIFLSPVTRMQIDGMYYGPNITAQGSSEGFYGLNASIRQDLFKRKLTLTLQMRDILGSMQHEFTSNTADFSNTVRFKREPQVVMLSLSFKFNNFKQGTRRDSEGSEGGNGGMEMEGGF